MIILAGESTGRDIRPSDHGFHFQNSSAAANSPMEMFFNSTSTNNMPLPNPVNSTDYMPPLSWRRITGGGGGKHWGGVLMVISLVCGITGVIILLVTAFVYFFNRKRNNKPTLNESFRHP
ncbi:hypothetical protein TanjilG_27099 [Lupinus angustifolius]|uniref:Uncharacterized protein n=2 Tax=Lupinus angustifolius TaxID=3871 RepID=A0A4P1QW30_LUPAN|nr:hypothetical protein TanjilG_27099 [Lupinus angustifolius]